MLREYFLPVACVILDMAALPRTEAQTLNCIANAGVPPLVRSEGLAERVGDYIVFCMGSVPTPIVGTVQATLNTNLTGQVWAEEATEAVLLIDEPTSLNPSNTFLGIRTGANSVAWNGVPIAAAGPSINRVLRITNIRVNANQLVRPGSVILPPLVQMTVSLPRTPLLNPTQSVAFVFGGMTSSIIPTGPGMSTLRFGESFSTSFQVRISSSQDPSMPGVIYYSESGFVNTAYFGAIVPPGLVGVASYGTRLMARFRGVTSDSPLLVSVTPLNGGANQTATLTLTTEHGAGPFTPIPPTTFIGGIGYAAVPVIHGEGIAVWEITASSPFSLERFDFGVSMATGDIELISLGLASISDVRHSSPTAPVPRFVHR